MRVCVCDTDAIFGKQTTNICSFFSACALERKTPKNEIVFYKYFWSSSVGRQKLFHSEILMIQSESVLATVWICAWVWDRQIIMWSFLKKQKMWRIRIEEIGSEFNCAVCALSRVCPPAPAIASARWRPNREICMQIASVFLSLFLLQTELFWFSAANLYEIYKHKHCEKITHLPLLLLFFSFFLIPCFCLRAQFTHRRRSLFCV